MSPNPAVSRNLSVPEAAFLALGTMSCSAPSLAVDRRCIARILCVGCQKPIEGPPNYPGFAVPPIPTGARGGGVTILLAPRTQEFIPMLTPRRAAILALLLPGSLA